MIFESVTEKINELKQGLMFLLTKLQRQLVLKSNYLIADQLKKRTSELEQITAQITLEKEKIAQLIKGLPGLMIIFDQELNILDQFEGKFDPKLSRYEEFNIKDVFARHRDSEIKTATAQLNEENVVVNFEFSDGRGVDERAFRCSVSAISASQFVFYIQDDTERVIKDRLIQVQKSQIVQASKLSSLGEMAGNIAHEVNTPLGTIFLLAGQIEKYAQMPEIEPEKILNMSHKIQKTVMRISSTVKSLKQISRDGSADPFEGCSLFELVEEALDLCREKFHMNSIELNLEIDPRLIVNVREFKIK